MTLDGSVSLSTLPQADGDAGEPAAEHLRNAQQLFAAWRASDREFDPAVVNEYRHAIEARIRAAVLWLEDGR